LGGGISVVLRPKFSNAVMFVKEYVFTGAEDVRVGCDSTHVF
jgi:hypothetical protein